MLDNLRTGLRNALKKIVGATDINEELIDSLCKDVQRSLLQSDVNVKLVISITKNLKERAINEKPPKGLSRKDHIILFSTANSQCCSDIAEKQSKSLKNHGSQTIRSFRLNRVSKILF